MPEGVKNFDPLISLCGGHDGLNSYRIIADKAKNYLKKDGFICVEVGNKQSRKVNKIFELKKFTTIDVLEDLSNIERVIIFKNKIWVLFFKMLVLSSCWKKVFLK